MVFGLSTGHRRDQGHFIARHDDVVVTGETAIHRDGGAGKQARKFGMGGTKKRAHGSGGQMAVCRKSHPISPRQFTRLGE